MHLISALAAGVRGAENGQALIARRGTSTPTRYFRSFEGIDPVDTGEPIALDANGGAEIYVDDMVSVTVRATDGTLVRKFVAGVAISAVEVRSKSFTGQEYDDGSGQTIKGTSRPTTAQARDDLWIDKNGAPDWEIKVGDSIGTIPNFISALANIFVNVKADEHGAVGDLVADDLAAFQSADADATARGGATIFVPPSIGYRLSGRFTLSPGNSLLADGPDSALIAIDDPTSGTILVDGTAGASQFAAPHPHHFIEGIRFGALQANTGAIVEGTNARIIINNCVFGDQSLSNGDLLRFPMEVSGRERVQVDKCHFYLNSATASAFTQVASSGIIDRRVWISDCYFTKPAGAYTGSIIISRFLFMKDCYFPATSSTNGGNAFNIIEMFGSGRAFLTGNDFAAGDGTGDGDGTAILSTSGLRLHEAANLYATDTKLSGTIVTSVLGSLRAQRENFFGDQATITVDPNQFDFADIERTTTNANVTIDATTFPSQTGLRYIFSVENNSGGNVVVTLGTNFAGVGETVSNARTRVFEFVSQGSNWVQVNDPQSITH